MNARRLARLLIGGMLLTPAVEGRGWAQTPADGGFTVREVSLATGYASLQLPPITLAGQLPTDVLDDDALTSVATTIDWRHATPRTRYELNLFGSYGARARYSRLSAPGGSLTFDVSRALGQRWRVDTGIASAITSMDQLAFQPTQTSRLAAGAASLDDLAGTVAFARSPSPDLTQAVLFVPISQSLAASDLYGNRVIASSAKVNAVYTHSVRLATHLHADYTTTERLSASNEPGNVLAFQPTASSNAGVSVRYGRSERSQVTVTADWSRASGVFADEVIVGRIGYAWVGRKWFTDTTIGTAFRPFDAASSATTTEIQNTGPAIVASAAVGYKFRTQTVLLQYRRASHDEYGHGGRNTATGFEGEVQYVAGSWAWTAPRSRWVMRSDFSLLRGPGNFSFIYAWLSTAGIGRQLTPDVRLMGEVLFDRHGSRMFEGFHLTREGARINLVWTPQRRRVG